MLISRSVDRRLGCILNILLPPQQVCLFHKGAEKESEPYFPYFIKEIIINVYSCLYTVVGQKCSALPNGAAEMEKAKSR